MTRTIARVTAAALATVLGACHGPQPAAATTKVAVSATSATLTVDQGNPRYFRWRGRTQALIGSTEHYGAVINPRLDFETYLDTVERDGLNLVRLFLGDYIEDGHDFGIVDDSLQAARGTHLAPWARSDRPGAADGGNRFDLDRWDPVYFDRLHAFMRAADRRGIVVECVLFFVGPSSAWGRSPLHTANNINGTSEIPATRALTLDNGNVLDRQRAYAEKLTRELNRYDNLIIDLVNEPWFGNQEQLGFTSQPPASTRAWMRTATRWIRAEEAKLPKRHVVTADLTNRGIAISAADLDGAYAELDGFNVHYDSHGLSLLLNRNVRRPFGFNETGFQGADDGPYLVDGWRYMLLGGALYDHLDYSFTVAHPDGSYVPRWPETGYTGGGSAPLRRQLAGLLRFMNALPLGHMQPDDGLVLEQGGRPAVAHQALSWPGHVYVVFFPGAGPIEAAVVLEKGRWIAEWIDVTTGRPEATQPFEVARWATPLSPHDRHDGGAVLRICRAGEPPCGGVP